MQTIMCNRGLLAVLIAAAMLFAQPVMAQNDFAKMFAQPNNSLTVQPDTPVSIYSLIWQWSRGAGRDLKWEAGYDVSVLISEYVQPTTEQEFERAFSDLNKILATHSPRLSPLVACVFADKVVVRTVTQPECDKPLN